MALVQAPNGDVYELNDSVASGFVGGSGGWSYAKSNPAARGGKGKGTPSVDTDVESVTEEAVAESESVESVEEALAVETKK